MAKREEQRANIDENDVEEENESNLAMEGNDGEDDDDDDDDGQANEDPSLKVVEKALLMPAARLDQNENDAVVVSGDDVSKDGCGVVTVDGGDVGYIQVAELSSSPSIQAEAVATVIVAKEEEKHETIKAPKAFNASEELPESMNPNGVMISDNIVLRKLLRGPRYFDPPENGWLTCYNCGEEGHMAVNCLSLRKKKKPCFVCGSLEHGVKECKNGRVCFICQKGGHQAKDCPEKNKEKGARKCLKCGYSGHDMFSCQNGYPLDDLKEIQCYICKGIGHLCCTEIVDDGARGVSCYKCGELGHYAMACLRLHEEANSTASPGSCYKCGERGHFARECTRSVKRKRVLSTSKNNRNKLESKYAPRDFDKDHKRKRSKSEERGITTAQKPKNRGGRTVEHPGHSSKLKSKSEEQHLARPQKSKHKGKQQGLTTPEKSKCRGDWITENSGDSSKTRSGRGYWRSPSTPFYNKHEVSSTTAGYMLPNSRPSMKMHGSHMRTPLFPESPTPFIENSGGRYQQRYSASRLHNSGGWHGNSSSWYGNSSSAGTRRFPQRYSTSRFDADSGGWNGNSGGAGTRRGYDWQ